MESSSFPEIHRTPHDSGQSAFNDWLIAFLLDDKRP